MPLYARVGIIAGCSFATTLIRVFVLTAFDQLVLPRSVTFDAYIDGMGINAIGSIRTICKDLPGVASQLKGVIDDLLHSDISLDKAGFVSSSKEVSRHVQKRLGGLGGQHSESVVNLGIDDTAGGARRVRGRNSKAKGRLSKA